MRIRATHTLAAVVAATLSVAAAPAAQKSLVGGAAPTFTLPVASHGAMAARTETITLSARPERPTVVMFVATDCPVSNAYNERMTKLSREYAARGVDFIGVNSNKSEGAAKVAQHARDHGLTFPIVKDPDNKVADRYNAQVTPEVYVVDTKGVVRYHGRIDNSRNTANVKTQELRDALDDVLASREVRTADTQAFGCTIKRVTPE